MLHACTYLKFFFNTSMSTPQNNFIMLFVLYFSILTLRYASVQCFCFSLLANKQTHTHNKFHIFSRDFIFHLIENVINCTPVLIQPL